MLEFSWETTALADVPEGSNKSVLARPFVRLRPLLPGIHSFVFLIWHNG